MSLREKYMIEDIEALILCDKDGRIGGVLRTRSWKANALRSGYPEKMLGSKRN